MLCNNFVGKHLECLVTKSVKNTRLETMVVVEDMKWGKNVVPNVVCLFNGVVCGVRVVVIY